MAVTQISRIQHRRGLEQDLPQLSSAELGWSLDTRKLYIGNGTLEEGAPIVGVTRILTEQDLNDLASNLSIGISNTQYTFVGNAAGYTVQTGPSALAPVIRSYQEKFDDFVNVRDFGATGNGTTDDTSALNRALQQIYKSTVSPSESRARRTIYFPSGSYKITTPLLIPTYAKLVGDGLGSTIVNQINGNQSAANICDSLFQSGSLIGTNSAVLPRDIEIIGMQFFNSNNTISQAIFNIDSASNVKINSCKFYANNTNGSFPNLVSILSTNSTTSKINFDSCQFIGGGNGLVCSGSLINSLRVFGSSFNNQANVPAILGTSYGFVGVGNYYDSLIGPTFSANNFSVDVGLSSNFPSALMSGIFLGNMQQTSTQQFNITTAPLVLNLLSNSGIKISYELKNGTNIRFGDFTYISTNTETLFYDNYLETGTLNANLYANNNSFITSVTSGSATLKFNFIRFI